MPRPHAFVLVSTLLACAPPQPVLVSPKGVETPLPTAEAVGQTDAGEAGIAARRLSPTASTRTGRPKTSP